MGNLLEQPVGAVGLRVAEMLDDEQAAVLKARGWLSGLPPEFQDAVLAACQPLRREAGAPLYHSGDDAGGLFGLCRGAIEISTPLGDPGVDVIHLGQPGFWLGATPALTGSTRRISASARTDCVLAHLSLTAMNRMMANRPEWWRHIGALAVVNMQVVIGAAADLLIRDHERRCIAVLLRLCGARYEDPLQDAALDAAVSQEELAAMSHLSRNAAGAVLRRLAAAGLVELGYRSLILRAPGALRGMVDAPLEV